MDTKKKQEDVKAIVPDGEIAMVMTYATPANDGKTTSRVVTGATMPEIIVKAQKIAKADGKNFRHNNHVVSWERKGE